MDPSFVNTVCGQFTGAVLETPFGPDTQVWKVGGRMFAAYALEGSGVSLRCRDLQSAAILVELSKASQPPYLKDGAWVLLPWTTTPDELEERLITSYDVVVASLPKSIRFGLRTQGTPDTPGPSGV